MMLNILKRTGKAPLQIIMQLKMSVLPKLRNLRLEEQVWVIFFSLHSTAVMIK